MWNTRVENLHKVALAMAPANSGKAIGEQNAATYTELVSEVRSRLPDETLPTKLHAATAETTWNAFAGMTGQLKGVGDFYSFAS